VFLTALLNSQPMGFYAPSQLVQDARRHGVQVLPVDVTVSWWDCGLASPDGQAVRLGLRLVGGLSEDAAQRTVNARLHLATQGQVFTSVAHLAHVAALTQPELDALAAADALAALAGHRREQVWAAAGAKAHAHLLAPVAPPHDPLAPGLVPAPSLAQDVVGDYAATGLSLRAHPVGLLRPRLGALKLLSAAELAQCPSGRLVRACGIVTVRQQPGTAKGVVFVTLEDETGSVNVVVWKSVKEAQRRELVRARLLAVYGVWQRDDSPDPETGGRVCHLVAKRLKDLSAWLGELDAPSRDFH
jgi:error-prone DNA polymerase